MEPHKKPTTEFTIEHILNRAGEKRPSQFYWLQCTRYKPPKLNRCRKREGTQRRKLGRNPRIPFSGAQVAALESKYRESPYLSSQEVAALSKSLALSQPRVKIWFQNRRARERREKETKQEGREEGGAIEWRTSIGHHWPAQLWPRSRPLPHSHQQAISF